MEYEWKPSKKGNVFANVEGVLCIIGKGPYGYWVRVGGGFLKNGKWANVGECRAAAIEAARAEAKANPPVQPQTIEEICG